MDPNEEFAATRMSVSHAQLEHEPDRLASPRVLQSVGRGDVEPLLEMPSLGVDGEAST